jgi:hypothetical protein
MSEVPSDILAMIQAKAGTMDGPETPCAWPGCTRSCSTGHVLVRVNPKGEPGLWMCRADAIVYRATVSR